MMDRRRFLVTASAASAALLVPKLAFAAAETERRLVFIIQRGAADGLHIIPPLGDPDYAKVRESMMTDPATAT